MTDREKALADALQNIVKFYKPFDHDKVSVEQHNNCCPICIAQAALALPERSDPIDSWVVPGPVFRWLLGEEGDFVDPSGTNRPYFWRKKLRDSALRLRAPAAPVAELSGKPGYANMDGRDLGRGSGMVYDLAAVHASAPAGELSDRERAERFLERLGPTKYGLAWVNDLAAEFASVRASSATLTASETAEAANGHE